MDKQVTLGYDKNDVIQKINLGTPGDTFCILMVSFLVILVLTISVYGD